MKIYYYQNLKVLNKLLNKDINKVITKILKLIIIYFINVIRRFRYIIWYQIRLRFFNLSVFSST